MWGLVGLSLGQKPNPQTLSPKVKGLGFIIFRVQGLGLRVWIFWVVGFTCAIFWAYGFLGFEGLWLRVWDF